MTNSDDEPKEWYLNPVVGYKCKVNENGIGLSGNEVHVIEFAAYEKLQSKLTRAVAALTRIRDNENVGIDHDGSSEIIARETLSEIEGKQNE